MMRVRRWAACTAGIWMILLGAATSAQGQVATFTQITDAVPARFFNPVTTAADPSYPNRLEIGFHSGIDWRIWKYMDFRASSASFSHTTAMDTLNVVITAPAGYYISSVTYNQQGSGFISRTGFAGGAGTLVVNGQGTSLGVFATNPTLSRTVNLMGRNLTTVSVSVSVNLSAFATVSLGSATLSLTDAEIVVGLSPLSLGQ
jgi:hypothetical protein